MGPHFDILQLASKREKEEWGRGVQSHCGYIFWGSVDPISNQECSKGSYALCCEEALV